MDPSNDIWSWITIAVVLTGIFFGCGLVIKKFLVDKKYFGGGQFVGRMIFRDFQNADRKKCIEHVIYMEEDESLDDFTAADGDPTAEHSNG